MNQTTELVKQLNILSELQVDFERAFSNMDSVRACNISTRINIVQDRIDRLKG